MEEQVNQSQKGSGCGKTVIIVVVVIVVLVLVAILGSVLVCGSCAACFGAAMEQAEQDRQAIEEARTACQPPNTFRIKQGGLSTSPDGWECATPEQVANDRQVIEAARAACPPPQVFRAKVLSNPAWPSSWECVDAPRSPASKQVAEQVPPTAPAVPDPEADYHSLDDIQMDGAKAKGKTALLRVRRGTTEAKVFTAYPCGGSGGINWAKLTFGQEHQGLVRAIPTSSGDCPRVLFRVSGRERFGKNIKGEVIAILDVEAQAAQEAPEGVDFVSMDDINIAGKAARGKIGLIEFWRGNVDDRSFVAYPCARGGGISFIKMNYTAEQREFVRQLPTSSREGCRSLRFKLRSQAQFGNTWQADLLEGS